MATRSKGSSGTDEVQGFCGRHELEGFYEVDEVQGFFRRGERLWINGRGIWLLQDGRRGRLRLQIDRKLPLHLLERQAVAPPGRALRREPAGQVAHGLFQIRIVAREAERGAILHERLGEIAAAMVDLGEPADRGQILRRALEHLAQLGLRLVELIQLEKGTPERDARAEISGMDREAGVADRHRLLELAGAAVLFGKLSEGDRRRVLFDPAPEVVNSLIVGHP